MSVFDHPEFDHHEAVHYAHDKASGLKAIIAVHSTALGPAAGGCRRWQYVDDEAAVTDALRLSRGMTYKNAVAGLPFGGGKAVILSDGSAIKSAALLAAYGRFVESLGGSYITAEDVGLSVEDMRQVNQETRFVSGLPRSGDGAGGDPSPLTALGVYLGIKAAVEVRLDAGSLKGLRVAVQGVGHVGLNLCRLLHDAGAILTVADVNENNLQLVRDEMPATEIAPEDILSSDVDVLAPCALGGILTPETIPLLKAKIVAGAANNQLASVAEGTLLADRQILYAPDYVINAGGIINVAREFYGNSSEEEVRTEVGRIPERLKSIFAEAEASARPTNMIADELARRIVAAGPSDVVAAAEAPAPSV
jgi:leucine dehydrogenase